MDLFESIIFVWLNFFAMKIICKENDLFILIANKRIFGVILR